VAEDPVDAQASQMRLLSQQELMDKLTWGVKVTGLNQEYARASGLVARELGVQPGQEVILVNGRVSFRFAGVFERR
jgi:hypothetical protein